MVCKVSFLDKVLEAVNLPGFRLQWLAQVFKKTKAFFRCIFIFELFLT